MKIIGLLLFLAALFLIMVVPAAVIYEELKYGELKEQKND